MKPWMLLVLLIGCKSGGDERSVTNSDVTGAWPNIETPADTFTPGLNVLVDGVLVPDGDTIWLGETTVGATASTVELLLSNATDSNLSLDGFTLGGDVQVSWGVAPSGDLAAGESTGVSVVFQPDTEGLAQANLTLNERTWMIEGDVVGTALLVVVGRLGRTLISDDFGASYFVDEQTVTDPAANEWLDDSNFADIAYANGLFVAVGGSSQRRIATSPDGRDWQDVANLGSGAVDAVAYGLGGFFAVDDGDVLSSTTGTFWLETSGPWRGGLGDLAFGNGRFVGVGGNRRVVSVDGQSLSLDIDVSSSLNAITFCDGVFVAVGGNGLVATTTDGEAWTEVVLGSANRSELACGDGQFVVGGWPDNTYTSPDGITWTEQAVADQIPPSGFVNGTFVGFSWRDRIWSSPNGVDWTLVQENSSPELAGFSAMAFGSP